MTNQKAIRAGVAPGGLFSKENIRIMMCYLLKSLDTEISQTEFTEILTDTELANYFEISDALSYLENSPLANVTETDGEAHYRITEAGKKAAENLYSEIPRSAREKAYSAAVRVLNRERMKSCTDVEIKRVDGDNCLIVMTVYDDDKNIMMETKLYAADYMQADLIGQRFLTDPSKLYSAVLDALTD